MGLLFDGREEGTELEIWSVRTLGLSKFYRGRPALQGLSLGVYPGERLLIEGPPGAGKTTLLRILATEIRPDHGSFYVAGCRVTSWPGHRQRLAAVRRAVGYLPDEPGLLGHLTGWEHGQLAARLHGLPLRESEPWLDALLDWADLAAQRHQPVHRWDRPARRRLALVLALLHRPPILLLEDPGRGQPADLQRRIAIWLAQHGAGGGTVLVTRDRLPDQMDQTRSEDPIAGACTRRLLLAAGRLVAERHEELARRR